MRRTWRSGSCDTNPCIWKMRSLAFSRLFYSTYLRQVDQVDLPKPWVFCLSFWVSCQNFEFFAGVFEFLLKILSFSLEFWEIFRGFSEFCFQICLFHLQFIFITMYLPFQSKLPLIFGLICLVFCIDFYQICWNLEFCAWVFSSLSFLAEVEKKASSSVTI